MTQPESASALPHQLDPYALGELAGYIGSAEAPEKIAAWLHERLGAQQIALHLRGVPVASWPAGRTSVPQGAVRFALPHSGHDLFVHPASCASEALVATLPWIGLLLTVPGPGVAGEPTAFHPSVDPLTALAGRAAFIGRLEAECDESRRYGFPLSLVLVSIDGMRGLNQEHGFELGDQALIQLGEILRRTVRTCDFPGRLGGGAFAVGLPHTDEAGAVVLAERIRSAFAALPIEGARRTPVSVTLSAGVVMLRRRHQSPAQFLDDADKALLQAKGQGGDAVCSIAALERVLPPTLASQSRLATLELARALEIAMHAKDPLTGGHARAVGIYAKLVAEALGLSPERQEFVFLSGLLHDIGKLAVPDLILKKEGPLTEEEWIYMRRHPVIAVNMLSRLTGFAPLHDPILYHHERLDGSGYPEMLPGDLIPLEARIVTVCDSYDAMTRRRCYTRARPHHEAIAELRRCAGTQFDPMLVELFIGLDLPDPLSIELESFLA